MTASGELFTVLDDTCHARVRFVAVNSPATGAGYAIPDVSAAQAAINTARGNDHRIPDLNLHDFVWHAVLLVSGANAAKCCPTMIH